MLPAAYRLTQARDFRRAIRTGRRAGSRTLVVHLSTGETGDTEFDTESDSASPTGISGPRVGLVVSKAVGNAVIRNRVQRRLRHLAREQLAALPGSGVLVVRALPPAASATSAELGADLTRCLSRVMS